MVGRSAGQKERRGPTIAHRIFAETDIPLLENDAARLIKDGRPFWLLGLGDQLAFHIARRRQIGVDDLAGTLAKVTDDAPRSSWRTNPTSSRACRSACR
jgi:hypothetical protein